MSRIKLREGGRPKKFIGGLISGGATMAAAAMQAAATAAAAKTQAAAMIDNARTQAQSVSEQTENSNQLQKESLAFTRQQNAENRQQQQDIQMTLQRLAGQANVNDRMEAQKVQVKYGGRPKRRKLKSQPSYGGGDMPFRVTDGGGVIPIQVDPYGYGLYELYGNDHEHYHKAPGGKNKTGVGIKFNDGSVVEGEGNQNSNRGELLYVTPDDAMFISKHSIAGFNPAKAVEAGVNPEEAFDYQEYLKAINGVTDDGTKAKCGKRKSIKRLYGGYNPVYNFSNITQLPSNGTAPIAAGTVYMVNPSYATSPVKGYGKMKLGGRIKANLGYYRNYKNLGYDYYPTNSAGNTDTNNAGNTSYSSLPNNFWNNYGGATLNAIGNIGGATLGIIGNSIAGRTLANAYAKAGDIMYDTYSRMHGIDMSEIRREDFAAPHVMAVIRDPNTNINPQLERIRRNAQNEERAINRGTLSSAARQQKLAAANDRMNQSSSEQYAYKNNTDEQIKQQNAQTITQVAQANADRDVQARQNYANQYLDVLKYNAGVDNARIAGMGQARADSLTQAAGARATASQANWNTIGSAINATGNAFSTAFTDARKNNQDYANSWAALGNEAKITSAFTRAEQTGDLSLVRGLAGLYREATDFQGQQAWRQIQDWARRHNVKL